MAPRLGGPQAATHAAGNAVVLRKSGGMANGRGSAHADSVTIAAVGGASGAGNSGADARGGGGSSWFSREDVALHDQPDDCWLVIHGQVYDVTSWVPKHPGGAMIHVHAGHDCTHLFESYHPLHVRKMLGKFCIGQLRTTRPTEAAEVSGKGHQQQSITASPATAPGLDEEAEGGAHAASIARDDSATPPSSTSCSSSSSPSSSALASPSSITSPSSSPLVPPPLTFEKDGEDEFYTVLKSRVEAFFKENKTDPRVHPHMYIKTCCIVVGYLLSLYGAFYATWPLWCAALSAVVLGVCTAQVGVSIQHDCNHGSYSQSPRLAYWLGLSLDLVGASSFMWKQQHVVGHHVATNVNDFDPDIRVSDPDVRRVTPQQPHRWYHKYQHVYLMALYSLLAIKSVFADDFSAYFSGAIGPVKLARMSPEEEAAFWGCKLFYAAYMFGLPAAFGSHGAGEFVLLYLIAQAVTGWLLAFMFQVAHVVEQADFPVAQAKSAATAAAAAASGEASPTIARSWAASQVATSTDFSHGSFFWTHFSGGLNYQIEHHLFPGVCHVHYPAIAPIVMSTCKEFGVPYHVFPSYWAALQSHVAHLKQVGSTGELRFNTLG